MNQIDITSTPSKKKQKINQQHLEESNNHNNNEDNDNDNNNNDINADHDNDNHCVVLNDHPSNQNISPIITEEKEEEEEEQQQLQMALDHDLNIQQQESQESEEQDKQIDVFRFENYCYKTIYQNAKHEFYDIFPCNPHSNNILLTMLFFILLQNKVSMDKIKIILYKICRCKPQNIAVYVKRFILDQGIKPNVNQ